MDAEQGNLDSELERVGQLCGVMRRIQLEVDEAIVIVARVYERALQDARSSNRKIAEPAQTWLDYVWPEWRRVHSMKSVAKIEGS